MRDVPTPFPPPPHQPKASLPMLYYGLIVVGTTAIVLALYNLVIIRWCCSRRRLFTRSNTAASTNNNTNRFVDFTVTSHSFENSDRNLLSSFKYKREKNSSEAECKEQGGGGGEDDESECVVCLSNFEEGEEIRQLPRCKHCFHVQCIDMWLYSHSDCPLCRAPVVTNLSRFYRHNHDTVVVGAQYQQSRESTVMGPTFAL